MILIAHCTNIGWLELQTTYLQGVQKKARKVNYYNIQTIRVWDTIHGSYERGTLRDFTSPSMVLYGRHVLFWDSLDAILRYLELLCEFPVLSWGTWRQFLSLTVCHWHLMKPMGFVYNHPHKKKSQGVKFRYHNFSEQGIVSLPNSRHAFYLSKHII